MNNRKIMKYILILSVLITIQTNAQSKLFNGNSIAAYSLCFAGGFSDGLNDCVVANKFYSDKFWGLDAWRNKGHYSGFRANVMTFTCDGWHLTKFASPVFYTGAVAITIGEKKQNWKYYAAKFALSLAASRLGHELSYNVIFKNYPK